MRNAGGEREQQEKPSPQTSKLKGGEIREHNAQNPARRHEGED